MIISERGSVRRFGPNGIIKMIRSFRKGTEIPKSAPEEQERQKRYGIRLSALTPDVFMDVLKIYDEVAIPNVSRVEEYKRFPDRVNRDLEEISKVARGDKIH